LGKHFQWVAFIDIDEFVHLLDYDSIKVVLPRYQDASGIQLQWLTFASSGHIARPSGLIMENYDQRLSKHHVRCSWVKPLVRPADIIDVSEGPHVFRVRGSLLNPRGMPVPPFAGLPPCHDPIVINHYYTKSREDWETKRRRGAVAFPENRNYYLLRDFDRHNREATVRDNRIMRFVPLVKQALAAGTANNPQTVSAD
jgi:hypothetical protein